MGNTSPYRPKRYKVNTTKTRQKEPRRLPGRPIKIRFPSLKRLFRFCLILFFLGFIIIAGSFAWYGRDLPNPEAIREQVAKDSTKILDRTGNQVLYEIYRDKKRNVVRLDELPLYVKWATVSIEDKNFYTHPGFDIKGIIRAALVDITRGKKAQGGSTITQQLVKNAILTPERTVTRKFKELILAFLIERKFSKDEILQLYLNEIPYGSTAYGIEVASQSFFEKSASELTLDETVLLTALPKAPTYYSPHGTHTEELLGRAHYILDQMAEQEYITKTEAEAAKQIDVLRKISKPKEAIMAPHFVFYVRELLIQELGERLVDEGGLTIVTSLDLDLQKKAESAIGKQADKNKEQWEASNAALAAINPKTGEVLAMVGSKDYFNDEIDGQVNVATRPRQPGSSFKPIVYAAAFEKGYTPDTVIHDVVTTFPTVVGPYTPHNYDLRERGPVTIRTALAGSLNIPAVKTIYLTGIDRVLNLASELGYTTLSDRSRFGLSLVLGGGEVTLLEHTNAFTAFANDGIQHQLLPILKVTDHNGNILLEKNPDAGRRVISEKAARWITSILSDNNARAYIFGPNNPLALGERPVAAKTGTTNNYKDGWTMGFTPSLVSGVWVGNSDGTEMKRGADGSNVAAPIWNGFMKAALEGKDIELFPEPPPNDAAKAVLRGVGARGQKVKTDRVSGKLATEWTPKETTIEKEFILPHCILYYLNKDDPRGPLGNPASDPQFTAWEGAVLAWAEKEKARLFEKGEEIELAEPPAETDDVHTPETRPKIHIIAPNQNAYITSNRIEIDIEASSHYNIREVRFNVDGKIIGRLESPPWHLAAFLPLTLEKGFHELEATVIDEVENYVSEKIAFSYEPKTLLDLELTRPKPGEQFKVESGIPITLLISTPEQIENISFYSQKNNEEVSIFAKISKPDEQFISFLFKKTSPGSLRVWADITRVDGTTIRTGVTTVDVF